MAESPLNIKIKNIMEDEPLRLAFDDLRGHGDIYVDFPDDVGIKGPVSGSAVLSRQGSSVHLSGKIVGVLLLSCHRCLARCVEPVDRDFFYILQALEQYDTDDAREVGLGEDDLDVWNYVDGQVKLGDIFREQLLLQVPQKVLCGPECRGLCPRCGTDLNRHECRCGELPEGSPFAVLKGLKVKGA